MILKDFGQNLLTITHHTAGAASRRHYNMGFKKVLFFPTRHSTEESTNEAMKYIPNLFKITAQRTLVKLTPRKLKATVLQHPNTI